MEAPDIEGPNLNEYAGPQFGHAMAAGDFDGDGKREVAVSTFEEESTSFTWNQGKGHVYVYEYTPGNPGTWSSGVEVFYLGVSGDPPAGVYFGYAMTAGDVDNDGKDELVVTAPGGDGAGADEDGVVFIYDWDSQSSAFALTHKFRSNQYNGGQLGDNFGWSVALADFNGDGDLDLIVGARYWSECEEEDNCVYGPGPTLLEDWTGSVYVFDHDGWESSSTWREVPEAELIIRGEASWNPIDGGEQTRGYFGVRVAAVGDVNGDGYDDFVATSPRRTPADFTGTCTGQNFSWWNGEETISESLSEDCRVGKAYLFAGAATYPSTEQDAEAYAKLVFNGEDTEDRFGQSLAAGGDLNGDGINDVVIASREHTETSNTEVGRVYIFLLPDYSSGWPSTDDAKHWDAWEANVIIDGPTGEDVVHFGYAMACNGNTNKQTDSRADLIVGAPRGKNPCSFNPPSLDENRGFAYLFRVTGTVAPGEDGDHLPPWAAVTDSAAYYQIKCDTAYRKYSPQFGRAIAFIGDANVVANYNDDFEIGCPGWDTTTYPEIDDRGGIYMIPF
ncbi:MAG: integrin alpha [Phycisphaerales bacterium]|nr:integrin alpha [Phycisphaerales bacterium]